ncbi:MAG: tail fiber domain-containing protein [Chthoniobacterales bacterium]
MGGGEANTITGNGVYGVIGGGSQNTNGGVLATIGGGERNTASGNRATIGGGFGNTASGEFSFAAGRRAKAMAKGAFVWADSADADFTVSTPNSFAVRANGGVSFRSRFFGLNQIVSWTPGKSTWDFTSDVGSKENFRAIDARGVLRRIASLPITEWSYKGHNQRNIGPMAQDWHEAFPSLSGSDKTINSGDVQGISLVAIQGLVEELKARDKAMAARDQTIEELKAKLQAVEQRLSSLPPAP